VSKLRNNYCKAIPKPDNRFLNLRPIRIITRLNIMSKFKLIIGFLLIVLIAGCAGGATQESTGEYFDDSVLTTKVNTSILGDSRLKLLDINVETFKGVVQLSGFVDSESAAKRAVELARTVKGVKSVNNSLIVKK
jgi:hypothetical protein